MKKIEINMGIPVCPRWGNIGNIFLCGIFLLLSGICFANENSLFKTGNDFYTKEDFENAIISYEKTLETTEGAEVYFNLGNAYYKTGNIPKAILNYERAKKRSPDDEDLKFNLNLVNQKITDRIDAVPALLINNWWAEFCNKLSVDGWAVFSVFIFVFALLVLTVFFIAKKIVLKRIGFFTFIISGIIFFCSLLVTHRQYGLAKNHDSAIIMSERVDLKSSPDENGKQLFILHAGTKVEITNTVGGWCEVKLPNGNKGWLKKNEVELI